MRAIAYQTSLPITDPDSLIDTDLPQPVPSGRDLLIKVQAVSVNPVDTKIRKNVSPDNGDWKVLGWDAAGVVVETGSDASLFKPGDEVFYAGSLTRPGTNAEFHLVDERIVGQKPRSVNWAEAAAMPLTTITAWEALFDRLRIPKKADNDNTNQAILIIGGAGGVGSMAIQLARQCTSLTVIATASRPESQEWVKGLGAHHVINHQQPLANQVEALEIGTPAYVFSTTQTDLHLEQIAQLIAPQGHLAIIDDPVKFDMSLFKRKSISVHWEFMFTRSMFDTDDIDQQGELLNTVSDMVDSGQLKTTLAKHLGPINATNLKEAHRFIESGTAVGKVVLEGFAD